MPSIPEVINGILVGDSGLLDKFGEPKVEVVVLGGIIASANMKAFLRLPLKYRLFCKPKEEEHLVQTEARGTRSRWVIRDKEARGRVETYDE